jgi:O-antigen/teichoic acid export membrane protein
VTSSQRQRHQDPDGHAASGESGPSGAEADPVTDGAATGKVAGRTSTGQVRGSNLLLVGRVLGLAVDFVAQILIVRYLTKNDYGAFALALSVVAIGTTVCLLGLERTLGRFAPIYEEQGDYGRVGGTIVTIFVTVASLGIVVVLGVYALQGAVGGALGNDAALAVLLVLIVLSPLQAIDSLMIAMFATFGSARSIFFRRYVFAPLVQLGVVVAVIATGSDVRTLALGYVLAAAIGIALYLTVLIRTLARRGLFERLRRERFRPPVREIFVFSIPLLASDLVFVLRSSITILLLGAMRSTDEVADFRAVLPLAVQMLFVATSFRLIYTPGASRLFARGDASGLNDLYWRTAVWVAIMTFPVFVIGLSLAEPVAVLLFGQPYEGTGVILATLVIGYYTSAALGFNSLTLRVFGRVRFMMVSDLITAAASLAATVLLIDRLGALGAAIGTTGSLIMQNLLYQWGLRTRTTVHAFEPRYARAYGSILVGAVVMVVLVAVLQPALGVGLATAGLVSFAVVFWNRADLEVLATYPELARFKIVRRILGDSQ